MHKPVPVYCHYQVSCTTHDCVYHACVFLAAQVCLSRHHHAPMRNGWHHDVRTVPTPLGDRNFSAPLYLWDHLLIQSAIAWNVIQYLTSLSLSLSLSLTHTHTHTHRLYSSYYDWQHNIPQSGHCHNFMHHSTSVGHLSCFYIACCCNSYDNGRLSLWDFFCLGTFSLEKILSVGW